MSKSPGISRALAEFVQRRAPREAAPVARLRARQAISDAVACMLAGCASEVSRIARAVPGWVCTPGPATVVGTALHAGPVQAAQLNAIAAHALDYDDMNATLFGHPSCTLVPAALACAELEAASGAALLAAYLLGLEVDARLGKLANPDHYRRGWHATSTLGVFGAVTAASRVLHIDGDALRNALAIAASQACGIRANFGTMTKALHAGGAAAAGVHAALLARAGCTGHREALDGDTGFFAAFGATERSAAEITAAFDDDAPLEIERGGIGYKPYACCGCATAAIDALLDLRAESGIDTAAVGAIECRIHPLATGVMPYGEPLDELQAKYSLSHCLAIAALDAQAGIAQFAPARVHAEDVRSMRGKVHIVTDANIPLADGNFAAEVTLAATDGRFVRKRVDIPRGDPRRPLPEYAARAKFDACAARVGMPAAQAAALHAVLERIEAIDDVRTLTQWLAVRP